LKKLSRVESSDLRVHVVSATAGGIDIHVRVVPRASRPGLAGVRDDGIVMRLRSAPVDNAANEELIERVAAVFRVPKRDVSIVSGGKSRSKRLHVAGLDVATATTILDAQVSSLRRIPES
jgi:uncharacterized protein (TIGR00251 family)